MTDINYSLIMIASLFAAASPGPATLAIAGTSMSQGWFKGAILAAGISTGACIWACSAAWGLSAIMTNHIWLFNIIRYLGALYLLFMAYQAFKSACSQQSLTIQQRNQKNGFATFKKGILIHLTNPKAFLFFGSLYSVGIPAGSTTTESLILITAMVLTQGFIVFQLYALAFSMEKVRVAYTNMHKWFDGLFSLTFGYAGFKVLTLKLSE